VAGGMKLEVWLDVVCPWCYLGKRQLDSALARFPQAEEVAVVWRSFELDPAAPRSRAGTAVDHLTAKYGMTAEQVAASWERLTALGAAEGIDFHLDRTRSGASFDAHRLIHLGAQRGCQEAVTERLFGAYFSEGASIGDPQTLARLGTEAGLDEHEVQEVLSGDRFEAEVREDEERARQLGVTGVPFFAIDERYGVSGARGADVLLEALAAAVENPDR
jgi:predicted DsbA family dithiol-disulfide isomerase